MNQSIPLSGFLKIVDKKVTKRTAVKGTAIEPQGAYDFVTQADLLPIRGHIFKYTAHTLYDKFVLNGADDLIPILGIS
jgi:hypothetical protein